ncbi:MAG TPA: DUF4287 domain-containing protein [Alphaproteobacteria bacterium]|jgi:hypothetical protein|nr:DUF4287 domain-containing protein [Alphaproteobacteria bacterium]
MPKIDSETLTEQQKKWFASVRAGLEKETGKSLAEWIAIAKTCPETKHRARLQWFKEKHGLLQNRASYVLSEAFPPEAGWDEPEALKNALWTDPASRAIFDAVEGLVRTLPDIVTGQRKGFSAWSRNYQFAAMRPMKGGKARLGLAVPPEADPALEPAKNEGWSERLTSATVLNSPIDAGPGLAALLRSAWEAS